MHRTQNTAKMIVQIHLTDAQLTEFLKKTGYETEMIEVTEWRSAYHNRDEPVTFGRLHVVLPDGSKKPAKEFFEKLIDESIINIIKSNSNGKS
jgi:hypothetical protein